MSSQEVANGEKKETKSHLKAEKKERKSISQRRKEKFLLIVTRMKTNKQEDKKKIDEFVWF